MQKQKIISLIQVIKNSGSTILKNDSLGFYFKAVAGTMFLAFLVMIPMWIISAISIAGPLNNVTKNVPPAYQAATQLQQTPIQSADTGQFKTGMLIGTLLILIGALTIATFTHTALTLAAIKVYEGNLPTLKALYKESFGKMVKMLGLTLIVGFGTLIGLLLFIIPGIILALGWALAPVILLSENVGVFEALKRSWQLTNGYKINLYLKLWGFMLLNIFFIPILIISAWVAGPITTSLYMGFTTLILINIYKDLARVKVTAEIPVSQETVVNS